LCIHPTGQGKYHILIDSCEEPFRIYEERLQQILNQNLKTYQSAKIALADKLEMSAKRLRNEENSIE
jgi:Lon protease-like protein